jgi:hypothetical protein
MCSLWAPRPPERILAVLPKPCVIVDYVLIKNTPSSYVCPPSTNSPDLSRISNWFLIQTVYSIRNPHQDRTVRLIKWWKALLHYDQYKNGRALSDTNRDTWQNVSRKAWNFWHPNRTRTKTNRDTTRINVQFLTRIHTSIIVTVSGARTCLSPCFTAPDLTNLIIKKEKTWATGFNLICKFVFF